MMINKSKDVVDIAFSSAILVALQVSLSFLPNIELVSFLFIIYGLVFNLQKNIAISFVFVTLQMLIWGAGDWVIGYYWIWALWVFIINLIKNINKDNYYLWAITNGLWGILFGILFSINHGFFYGFGFSLVYWTKGLPFDMIHTISNYVITVVVFKPVLTVFKKHYKR